MKRLTFLSFKAILIIMPLRVLSQTAELSNLAHLMAGSYSSEEQHVKDTVNYFDIRLQIIPVWKDRKDGYLFYVEQAMNGYLDKPYRQRVYHLKQNEATFESVIYLLKDPLRFTGKPEAVEILALDSLSEKEGCSVILKKTSENVYDGGTMGKNCPSDRKGATYATSKVTISENLLLSWDQGFNEKDEQVLGAEKGGYYFKKLKQY
jgi:CpeT protein